MTDTIKAERGCFCFCDYKDSETGEVETIYNATWMSLPPACRSRSTGNKADGIASSVRFAPEHIPAFGDRVFIPVTEACARRDARRMVEARIEMFGGEGPLLRKFGSLEAACESAFKYLRKHAVEPVCANTAVIEQLQDLRAQLGPNVPSPNDPEGDQTLCPECGEPHGTPAVPSPTEPDNERASRGTTLLGAVVLSAAFGPELMSYLKGYLAILAPALDRLIASKGEEGCFDRAGNPISISRWVELMREGAGDANILADDEVGAVNVSTVWLGVDQQRVAGGPPLVFETLVFENDPNGDHKPVKGFTNRLNQYSTEADARRGHAELLARVRAKYSREAS